MRRQDSARIALDDGLDPLHRDAGRTCIERERLELLMTWPTLSSFGSFTVAASSIVKVAAAACNGGRNP